MDGVTPVTGLFHNIHLARKNNEGSAPVLCAIVSQPCHLLKPWTLLNGTHLLLMILITYLFLL